MSLRLLSAALFLFLAKSNRASEQLSSSLATNVVHETEAPTPFFALPSFGLLQKVHSNDSPEVVNNARIPTCVWNPYGRKCSLDKWYILSQLEESRSDLAKIYTTFLRWQYGLKQNGKQKRSSLPQFELSDQELMRFISDYSSSPCYETTLAYCNMTVIQRQCRQFKHQAQCNGGHLCTWNKKGQECNMDSWNLIYGVKSAGTVPREFDELLQTYTDAYDAAFHELFGESIGGGEFDWDKVLAWDGPQYHCPPGVHQTVCDYAAAYTSSFSVRLYCNGKYPDLFSVHQCHNDPHCQSSIDPGPVCIPSEQSDRNTTEAAAQVFVSAIEDPLLKSLFESSFFCQKLGSMSACHNYDENSICQWNTNEQRCAVSPRWIASMIWKPNDDDPLCHLFEILKQMPCGEADYMIHCVIRRRQCEWHQKQRTCETKVDVFLKEILKEDKKLKQHLHRAQSACHKLKKSHCS